MPDEISSRDAMLLAEQVRQMREENVTLRASIAKMETIYQAMMVQLARMEEQQHALAERSKEDALSGRVKTLESWRSETNGRMSTLKGIAIGVPIFIGILTFILTWLVRR